MLKPIFSRPKYDGVVEAVHYEDDGQVAWVRAYERRGPTWSDHVLLDRQTLINRLKKGRRFYAGDRNEFQASEFEVSSRIKLVKTKNGEAIVLGKDKAEKDDLGSLPVI
ncbi:MAG: hypothetical protein DWQ07_13635 [Chloroflexi bacterium]|nr:MAG: hypothetical protein DWQ07_13635 [Chloroflexota bacterium]MBL1197402.1 hypothetical protein [Chloroflexota bacterium]NOH14698.1 hypothetical protein [Chloroflexota bacterium]